MSDLVRIPHIPLLSTGTFALSTGEFTFTLEDLQAAAAAPATDAAVQWPRLRIDGLSDSFDQAAHGGEPAAGRIENMVVEGETLYGDYVIPPGLADVIDWGFPSRSVEAVTGAMMGPTATGRTHELIITAVALLGVDLPGVSTLPDLLDVMATFSGSAVPDQAVIMATIAPPGDAPVAPDNGAAIRAGLDQELVRRRFYTAAEGGDTEMVPVPEGETGWALWIHSLRFDDDGAPYLVCESMDSGRLYRYDFTVSGNDANFTLNGEVVEQYVAASAAGRRSPVAVWASRDESRAVMANRGGAGMTPEQIAALAAGYGLDPDSATEADIMAAANAAAEARRADDPPADPPEAPAPVNEPEPIAARSSVPEGAVLIDADELARLRAGAETANTLAAERATAQRDTVLAAAMHEGRFAPARREHWERQWAADPEGTRTLLTAPEAQGGLAPNTIPVQARGADRQDGVNQSEAVEASHERFMAGYGSSRSAKRDVNGVRMISGVN